MYFLEMSLCTQTDEALIFHLFSFALQSNQKSGVDIRLQHRCGAAAESCGI